MNIIKKILFLTIVAGIVFVSNVVVAQTFVLDSLPEANRLSKATNRPVLLIFGTDSCNFCDLLKKSLESDLKKDVDNYIVCYLDIKKHPDLKQQYNISLIPDSRIIKDSHTLSTNKGFKIMTYKTWLQNNAKR